MLKEAGTLNRTKIYVTNYETSHLINNGYSSLLGSSALLLGLGLSFGLLISIGLLGLGISPSQGNYRAFNHKRATTAKCRESHNRYRGTAQQ
jgi:hypothetical protein